MRATSMHSIRAHDAISSVKDGQHQRILAHMRSVETAVTRKEIARALGFEPGTIAARTNELIHAGALVEVGTKRCSVSARNVGALTLSMCEGA